MRECVLVDMLAAGRRPALRAFRNANIIEVFYCYHAGTGYLTALVSNLGNKDLER
jgi:hypothetical protein